MSGWVWSALGSPVAQGSKRHVGHGVMVEQNKNLRPWRETMTAAAFGKGPCLEGPVAVRLVFSVPRAKSARKTDVVPYKARGDLDKLARAALDAVVVAGLLHDDAQVADFSRLAKCYPGREYDHESLPVPGVVMAAVEILRGEASGAELWHLIGLEIKKVWAAFQPAEAVGL